MERPPRLLHFKISHYNEKVRWALDIKRWPHLREAYTPGFHILGVRLRSGQNQLPVLVLEDTTIAGSNHILEEIERRRPDPPLFPSKALERERALSLQTWFDEEVAPDVRRLFWSTYIEDTEHAVAMATNGATPFTRTVWRFCLPMMRALFRKNLGTTKEQIAEARARLGAHFDRLESELGEGGYLVGDRFTVADLTAASIMTAIIRPPQFPYPLPEPWPQALVDLRASISDRAGFRWVLEMYEKHRPASCELNKAEARG